ncbi:MAG: FliM/FliN family flagellar motor switch protein [Hyphomicrobiaceae bacterium]|uniref:FliM/FliN family flagellar motor switch protein n=1 Tax=Pseudorhodoplanes sp. TaxID=1934341 RepID=UPI003D0C22EA
MSVATARSKSAMVRLLQRSRPKATELPGMQPMIDGYARACAETLLRVASLETTVAVDSFEQEDARSALHRLPGTILVLSFVPHWNARIVVRLDRSLLIRALDALYGGDPKKMGARPPARALTPLERSLAISIVRGLSCDLLSALGEAERAGSTEERLVESNDSEVLSGLKSEYVAATLRLVDVGEQLIVAFPMAALERLAEHLSATEAHQEHVVDLDWTQQFRRNVERTSIELVAKIDGPRLHLSDIAALKVGSLIEFDKELIGNVSLVASEQAIFRGRLGQSKGNFTVLLDRPLTPSRQTDERT